ncbi:MAG: glycosyltransferase [Erysipelotrichaceae bacterium]|nr:glycosyltransferase [Erysipelotrichaceae bacterium]
MEKACRHYTDNKSNEELIGHIGFGQPVVVDKTKNVSVLVVGAGSYIGESFQKYAKAHYGDNFTIDSVGTLPDENGQSEWEKKDFSKYDVVYHVAGIAHADVGSVSEETKEKYYKVNTDLAIAVAKKAKAEGVKEFIFMSSMIVYGDSAPFGKQKMITKDTVPSPANFYGDSKLQADVAVRELADDKFKVIVLRPPMIYGKGSKGNYPTLAKLAKKLPVFPNVNNQRSMLYVGNLCEFLCQLMLVNFQASSIVLFPQNGEYTKTADMVKEIARVSGNHIAISNIFNPAVVMADQVPGKVKGLVDKAFGNSTYDQNLSRYDGMDYQKVSLKDSVEQTEGSDKEEKNIESQDEDHPGKGKKVLIVASVASMIDQFNKPNIEVLQSLGYDVDVATNFLKDPGTITPERCQQLIQYLTDHQVGCYLIDFDRNVADVKADRTSFDELDQVFKGKAKPINNIKHPQPKYAFMHCHSPIGGAIGRVVAKRNGVKSIYTAHGFHFYDGAPVKNWLLFYPIEKELSRITDVLITINKEDYKRAKDHFYAKKVIKIPGVGVDTAKFETCHVDKEAKRKELGIPSDAFVLLSVGELSDRKNQKVVIEAMKQIKDSDPDAYQNIYYLMVGKGDKKSEFEELIHSYELQNHVKLLGFRSDIGELCEAVNCFVHPSIREGLGIAPLEAMAAGLPLISSYVNGIKDYTEDGKSGVCIKDPTSVEEMTSAILKMYHDLDFCRKCGANNFETAKLFDVTKTDEIMNEIYRGGYKHLIRQMIRIEKRKELGIGLNDFVIMSTGELNDNKNHEVIIRALAKFINKKKKTDIRYVIAGKGSKEQKLRRLIYSLRLQDHVMLLGYRSDIKELLWSSDCFAFPSKREGLGLAAIEAMAAGLPLLTSDAGGINDYSEDGVTGYKYRCDDVDGFVQGISKLYSLQVVALLEMLRNNADKSVRFDQNNAKNIMRGVYQRF